MNGACQRYYIVPQETSASASMNAVKPIHLRTEQAFLLATSNERAAGYRQDNSDNLDRVNRRDLKSEDVRMRLEVATGSGGRLG